MRIIAGSYKGRRLSAPKDQTIRPTSDKIRGAIFSALEARGLIEGAHVLDGFCGSGALALEALSRDADFALLIDKNKQSLDLAKENAKNLQVPDDQIQFMLKDTSRLKTRPDNIPAFDLIFLDPPYGQDLTIKTITTLKDSNWLNKNAFLVLETEKRSVLDAPPGFSIEGEKTYGDTKITYLNYSQPA